VRSFTSIAFEACQRPSHNDRVLEGHNYVGVSTQGQKPEMVSGFRCFGVGPMTDMMLECRKQITQ
jgi:hypothetical protein